MRWSFNINGQNVPNWEQLLAWGKEVRPAWTLIMDSRDKARQWKNEVGGEVTYRIWDERDNYYHQYVRADVAAEQMARDCDGLQDMWQYYRLNEAGGDWSPLQDWIIAFAEAARKRGFKSTAHGLAIIKNWPQPEWVEAGHVDKLIRYAYEHQDTFILNVHEYVTGFAWSAHTPNYPLNLFDRSLSLHGEQTAVINWHEYRPEYVNYYLGRVLWVTNIRAKKVVGDVIPFEIDEALFDWHASVHNQIVTLPDGRKVEMAAELRAVYGDNRYNRDIRGVLGQRRLFEWLATGDTNSTPDDNRFADVIMRNFKWTNDNYPPNCKSIQLFTMNGNWRFPHGHDYIPIANVLLPKMKTLATPQPTPVPLPAPTPQPAPRHMRPIRMHALNDFTNVRDAKSTTANIVGRLPHTPVTDGFMEDSDGVFIAPYTWKYVEFQSDVNTPIRGYVAIELIVEVMAEPAPPEPDYRALLIDVLQKERQSIVNDIAEKTEKILLIDSQLAQLDQTA